MSRQHAGGEEDVEQLILFVAGDSPRSRRARSNLAQALQQAGLAHLRPREIDLLVEPEHAVTYAMLATPALLRAAAGGGVQAVIYGDLSNNDTLMRFLSDCTGEGQASPLT